MLKNQKPYLDTNCYRVNLILHCADSEELREAMDSVQYSLHYTSFSCGLQEFTEDKNAME
jgi:hypothetical protein